MRYLRCLLLFTCIIGLANVALAQVLLAENFITPGTRLDLAVWTTETGAASYLGRTQLADWITPGGIGQFIVDSTGAQLSLSTFNPTGLSLYGTHAKTLRTFQPGTTSTIEFTTRLELTSVQAGAVYAMYLYRCTGADCATHDEIDIELVTNLLLQPGTPLRVQLNRYANEPLGAGNGDLVNLPAGFDVLAPHDWTIRWALNRIDYLVDGALLARLTWVSGPVPTCATSVVGLIVDTPPRKNARE
jgi:hypothetical protein